MAFMDGVAAGVYVRISDDRHGTELGVARQEKDCRAVVKRRAGWDVVQVYADDDRSAYDGKPRPAYERMLVDLATGRIKAVVAWHPDRLYRRLIDLEELIDLLEGRSVEVATVRAGEIDLTTSHGRMQARIAAVVARHESEHKS